MTKKNTFTCKICGGEHSGLICTKFASARALPATERKTAMSPLLVAPAPKPKTKAKKAKKTKKTKASS